MTIYKYPFESFPECFIKLPKNAKILDVNFQDTTLMIWCLVDENAKLETRHFKVYGTGWDMETASRLEYIKTLYKNNFVWHVFEIK